jgi:segregation and condensation protein B
MDVVTHDPDIVPWPTDEEDAWDVSAENSPAEEVTLARLSSAFAELTEGDDESLAEPVAAGSPETGQTEEAEASDLVAEDLGEVNPRGILESLLFVGAPDNRPLLVDEVVDLVRGMTSDEVHALVASMNAEYLATGCPYEIVSDGAGYRLALRPALNAVRDRFYGRLRETRLSQAAVEVLALVAYHEPLTAAKLNELRGSPSGAVLSQLVRRQLLRLEKGPGKGAAVHYFTTPRFLELFGLESLADLPRSQDMDQL